MEFRNIINFMDFVYSFHGNIPLHKFTLTYGIHLNTAAILFHFATTFNSKVTPIYILYFLDWIRNYPTVEQLCRQWHCDPKTFRLRAYIVLFSLYFSLDTVNTDLSIFTVFCI